MEPSTPDYYAAVESTALSIAGVDFDVLNLYYKCILENYVSTWYFQTQARVLNALKYR